LQQTKLRPPPASQTDSTVPSLARLPALGAGAHELRNVADFDASVAAHSEYMADLSQGSAVAK
jgi:hypothetical protein